MDAVIDHAHDNVADGDVMNAARLRDRLHVDMSPLPPSNAFDLRLIGRRKLFARSAPNSRSLTGRGPIPVSAARTRDRAENPATPLVPSAPPRPARVAPIVQ